MAAATSVASPAQFAPEPNRYYWRSVVVVELSVDVVVCVVELEVAVLVGFDDEVVI